MEWNGRQWIEPIKEDPVLAQVINQGPFVAKPHDLHGFSFFPRPLPLHNREELIISLFQMAGTEVDDRNPFKPGNFQLSIEGSHPLQRWNERVGPILKEVELERLLRHLFQLERMQFFRKGWGWIDQEIIFGYKVEGRCLIIQTFLGRISLKPALRNYDHLLHFYRRQDDYLDLTVPAEKIQRQLAPLLPDSVATFTGSQTDYRMEGYRYRKADGGTGVLYHLQQKSMSGTKTVCIDPEQPGEHSLTKRVLSLLLRYGHREFVLQSIAQHRLEKLMVKYWQWKDRERREREERMTS